MGIKYYKSNYTEEEFNELNLTGFPEFLGTKIDVAPGIFIYGCECYNNINNVMLNIYVNGSYQGVIVHDYMQFPVEDSPILIKAYWINRRRKCVYLQDMYPDLYGKFELTEDLLKELVIKLLSTYKPHILE